MPWHHLLWFWCQHTSLVHRFQASCDGRPSSRIILGTYHLRAAVESYPCRRFFDSRWSWHSLDLFALLRPRVSSFWRRERSTGSECRCRLTLLGRYENHRQWQARAPPNFLQVQIHRLGSSSNRSSLSRRSTYLPHGLPSNHRITPRFNCCCGMHLHRLAFHQQGPSSATTSDFKGRLKFHSSCSPSMSLYWWNQGHRDPLQSLLCLTVQLADAAITGHRPWQEWPYRWGQRITTEPLDQSSKLMLHFWPQ